MLSSKVASKMELLRATEYACSFCCLHTPKYWSRRLSKNDKALWTEVYMLPKVILVRVRSSEEYFLQIADNCYILTKI